MNNIQKEKVLVVDDNPENLMLVVNILKESYTVIAATDGAKALEHLFQEDKPDIVLLDIIMAGIDGYEVCRQIKSNPDTKHIPIIFITALEEETDILKGFDLGAVDYVIKPFEPKILKARVKTHLELKRFNDDLKKNLHEKEELLFQQSKMAALGEMFENITHQWKQPLAIISLRCANLKLEYDLGEFKEENLVSALDTIETSVEHLSQTINDFKNFIHERAEKEDFDLRILVESTLKLLSSKLVNRNIKVRNLLDHRSLFTHKNDLVQILMNLFNNAIEVLEERPGERWIEISTHSDGDRLLLQICDNGGGISETILPNIFGKYVTTKYSKGGSGLGLYMSRELMQKRLGGTLDVHNTGEGACFTLTLSTRKEEELHA